MKHYSHPVKQTKKAARGIAATVALTAMVGGLGLAPAMAEPTPNEIEHITSTYPVGDNVSQRADGSYQYSFDSTKYRHTISEINFDPIMLAQYEAMGIKIDVPASIKLTNEYIKSNAISVGNSANLQLVMEIDESAFAKHPASEKIQLNHPDGHYGSYGLASPYGFNNIATDALQDKTSIPVDKAYAHGSIIVPDIMGTYEMKNSGQRYNPETKSFDTPIGLNPLSSFYEGGIVDGEENVSKRSYFFDIVNPLGENRIAESTIGYNGTQARGMNPATTSNCIVSVCGSQLQLVAMGATAEDGTSTVALLEPLTFTVKYAETPALPQTFKENPWTGVNGDKVWFEVSNDGKFDYTNPANSSARATDISVPENTITPRDTSKDIPTGFATVISNLGSSVRLGDQDMRFHATIDNSKYSYETSVTTVQTSPNSMDVVFTNSNDVVDSPWIYADGVTGNTLEVGEVITEDDTTYTVVAKTHNSLTLSAVSSIEFKSISQTIDNTHGRIAYDFSKPGDGPVLETGVGFVSAFNRAQFIGTYDVIAKFTEPVEEAAPIARPDVKSGKYGEPVRQKVTVNDQSSEGWKIVMSSITLTDPTDGTQKKSVTHAGSGRYDVENDEVVFYGVEGFSGEAPKNVYTWTEERTVNGVVETREASSTVQAIIEKPEPVTSIIPEETPKKDIPKEDIPVEEIPVVEETPEELPTVIKDGGEDVPQNVLLAGIFGLMALISGAIWSRKVSLK